ncbi:DUF4232 domain-containing protein [Saccharopolyspora sp. NPDC049426]|uniref:DUF4232 domain-containing protein n=1 Tax=Saccharopolyspora sp. NPDC049426 TaxID=3155652 RepID=UPI00341F314B
MEMKSALKNNGKRLGAFGAALAAVAVSSACGQLVPQAPQPPATVTVTQPPPQESPTSGSESTSDSSEAPSKSKEPEAEDGLACAAEELQLQLDPNYPQADGSHMTLKVTNIGGRPCQIRGYGGLQFVDFNGKPVDTELNRLQANPPTITIEQSQSAGLDLTWDIYQSPCVEPETLQFTPPGDDKAIKSVWGRGAVCRGGLVDATAFRNVWGG